MTEILQLALAEDIGSGDVTTRACVPESRRAAGRFLAREPLVLAGTAILTELYGDLTLLKHDGDDCIAGEIIATVRGSARTLLEYERVALNFLQRLSGVATLARRYADAVAGTNCQVLDTRKTTPGMRLLEKAAAKAGGIANHRAGLYDAILIKNNHISAAGGVRNALEQARASGILGGAGGSACQPSEARNAASIPPIEIEVRTLDELHEALACGADHLLLDNLTPAEAAEWIREIAGRAKVELSGGITLETVRAYALTGADFVSAGAITHSAPAMDLSFRLELL